MAARTDQYYFYVNSTKPQNQDKKQQSQTEGNFYVGKWEIWVLGGYATTDSKMNGDGSRTITQQYVNGAWLSLDNGKIKLVKGQMESDWTVEKADQNQIKIYAWGMNEYGTRIK